MSFLNKRVEDSIKQAKLLAQMSELSYRALNGTRQTRSNFINNDLKEQADTDKPAVGSLTSEMIAQYKREEEEKNKYVDPKGNEFLYAPAGIAPTILTPSYVDVTSLGAPATITDVEKEQSNYTTILQDLNNKKQEIEDKKREVKEKEQEMKSKEKEKNTALAEYTQLKKEESDKTTKLTDDEKVLKDLQAITSPTVREQSKIRRLLVTIPKLETRLKELTTLIGNAATEFTQFEKEEKDIETEIKVLEKEIKSIPITDIRLLEKKLTKSEKLIETYQENIKENEIIERDTERENKEKLKAYQDTFNIMNKNRYQVTQDPTETDADFIKRIKSLESLPFDPTIFKDRASTEGNKKFMKNLKDITRDEVQISTIVKSFPSPEEVFLINSNWSSILNILKRQFGLYNKEITASEYKSAIDEALESIQSGKTTNITVVAPGASAATPSATPFATPSATPSTGLLSSLLGSTAAPSTPGPAATATTTSLANDIPDDTGMASGYKYEEEDNSLVISNTKGDIVYIKIGISRSLKKVLFSKTDNNQGSFKAFNFVNVSGVISFSKFVKDFFSGDMFVYQFIFGKSPNYSDIYDHLKNKFSLSKQGDLKQIDHEGKKIVGYGLKTESIPDICHFGKNIILLKKLYYNNILSVKNKKMHAIEYFTNVKVSDNFVDVILQMCKNSKPNINNLTTDEKQLLDTLLHVCGIKSSANSSKKDDVVNELKNKFKLAEGQLRAGNNNPLIIKELKDILKKLTLYNVVTLKNSKDYLKQF
jgi:hypothetical protein